MRIHFSEYKIPYVCSRIANTFLAKSCAMKGNMQMMFCSCSCIVIMNISYGGKHVHKQCRQHIIIIFLHEQPHIINIQLF